MYFIVPHGQKLDVNIHERHANATKAMEVADAFHKEFGIHYHVMNVYTVWTTKTLADLKAEEVVS